MVLVSIHLQVIHTSMLTVYTEKMSNQKLLERISLKHSAQAMASVLDMDLILIIQL